MIDADFRRAIFKRAQGVFDRCYNPNDKDYQNYGARDIKIEPHLLAKNARGARENFYNFLVDLIKKEGICTREEFSQFSIDRIDGSKGYERSNIRLLERSNNELYTSERHRALYFEDDFYPIFLIWNEVFKQKADYFYKKMRKNLFFYETPSNKARASLKKGVDGRGLLPKTPMERLLAHNYKTDIEVLKAFNGVIYYNFQKKPLIFNKKYKNKIFAKCPKCKKKGVIFDYEDSGVCKCHICRDFKAILRLKNRACGEIPKDFFKFKYELLTREKHLKIKALAKNLKNF